MDLDDAEIARLYAYPATDRPWVRTNFVATVDGAAHGTDGVSGTLGGDADKKVFDVLRSPTNAGISRLEMKTMNAEKK